MSHLVLAATFLRSPLNPWLAPFRPLARPALFTRPPPALALRCLLAGWDAAPSIVASVRDAMAIVPPMVAAARARAALAADDARAFASLTVPTLWIRATRDRLLRTTSADDASASRPDVRVVSIDGPHMILQRPRECLAVIERFLATSAVV